MTGYRTGEQDKRYAGQSEEKRSAVRGASVWLLAFLAAWLLAVGSFSAQAEEILTEGDGMQETEGEKETESEDESFSELDELIVEGAEVVDHFELDASSQTALKDFESELYDTITGFSATDTTIYLLEADKPSEQVLTSRFPDTLKVQLNGHGPLRDLKVSWQCVGDHFDSSKAHYFQFSPRWDEERYRLSGRLDYLKDVPYYAVFVLSEEAGLEYAAGTDYAENEAKVFSFLTDEMGLSTAAACGIMANIRHESGFNPQALGDGGTSYGLCQWHNGRWTSLRGWCEANGLDWMTLRGQLQYMKHELSQSSSAYLYNGSGIEAYLRSVPDTAEGAWQAAWYWCCYYEIPSNKEYAAIIRGNLAKNAYFPKYNTAYRKKRELAKAVRLERLAARIGAAAR